MGRSSPKVTATELAQLKKRLQEVNPDCHLEVDGGVDMETAKFCKENGANVFVAGSACLRASDKTEFIRFIEN